MYCQCTYRTSSQFDGLNGSNVDQLCAECGQLAISYQTKEGEAVLSLAQRLLYESNSLEDEKEAVKQAMSLGMNLQQIGEYLDWADFHKQQILHAQKKKFKQAIPFSKAPNVALINHFKS